MTSLRFLFLILFLTFYAPLRALFPIGVNRFDETIFKPTKWRCNQFNFGLLAEGSVHTTARNGDGCKVNVLNMWNDTQDALAMVRGFCPDSEIGKLAAELNDVNDDGIRGNFDVCGKLKVQELALAMRYWGKHNFYADIFFPTFYASLSDVTFTDLTENTTFSDALVKEYLTSNFKNRVKDLGNLSLDPWTKGGPGDLVVTLGWVRHFPQQRDWLNDVRLWINGGTMMPTGQKKNEDQIFSIPFGNDGAWSVFGQGNIELTWCKWLVGGVDIRFMYTFGHTKERRIKTDLNQTDLLLLAKADSYLDNGVFQKYYLYLSARNFFRGMSFTAAYNYIFQHESQLFLRGNCYNQEVANSAQSLEDWTIHNFIFMWTYDWQNECAKGASASVFLRLPFNGRRSVQATVIGGELNLSF